MLALKRSGVALAVFAAVAIAAPVGAEAGVMSISDRATISPDSPLEQVHYRRYHHHHHWRHAHWRHRHYGYGYPYYNPAGAVAGAAVGLATAPAWALLGGPYWW